MSADLASTSVETSAGFQIESSEPITKEEREFLSAPKAKPIPAGTKPAKAEKAEPEFETEAVDEKGKTHGPDGRFRGNAKGDESEEASKEARPAADAKKEAKPKAEKEDAAEEAEEPKAEKEPTRAQERIRTLAELKNKEAERADRAERERERLARELEAIKAKPAEPKPEPKAEEPKKEARPKLSDYDDYDKYEADVDAYYERKGEEIADRRFEKREAERQREENEQREAQELQAAFSASDKAIKEAGGRQWLDKVAPTLGRLVTSREAERNGREIGPLNILADYVARAGKHTPMVGEYLHANPDIVDTFEQIGLLPKSRQPEEVNRELAMLHGAMRVLYKSKAHATTDTPEPDAASFKPRAAPPPPSVQGSPSIAEPDLSNLEDFDEYMAKTGTKRRH